MNRYAFAAHVPSGVDPVVPGPGQESVWDYPRPPRVEASAERVRVIAGYEAIAGHLAFHVAKVDEAWVDDERARPQEGGFYGGWVTTRITGPIKGGPGSWVW